MSDGRTSVPEIAAVILAAGESKRFGCLKPLLPWKDRPFIVHAVDTAWNAGLSPILVVLGAGVERIAPVLTGRPVQILTNYRWQEGLSSSLSVGVSALSPSVDAAVFLPVDQPLLTADFLRRLVACSEAGIVAPSCEGVLRGSPALFSRKFFSELARLGGSVRSTGYNGPDGDVGGRALFTVYPDDITALPVEDPRILMDIDTPEAYAHLLTFANDVPQDSDAGDFFSVVEGSRFPKAVIADMDGVLWHEQTPLPGLYDFFTLIETLDIAYMLITNNSSRTPAQYTARLARFGIEITPDHVLTSAIAASDYLAERLEPGSRLYVIGGPGVIEALKLRGFRVFLGSRGSHTEDVDELPSTVDYVVVGWDRELTWEKLATATQFIRRGAKFLGTNPDLTFPGERGILPGNGAQLAALKAATGVSPVIAGKPEPILYRQALARMGVTPRETLMIGDLLETDILGGTRVGMRTALVLSGVTAREDLGQSSIRPDVVFEDLAALVAAWRKSDV
jgi:4-nitrophenyl phosphatase